MRLKMNKAEEKIVIYGLIDPRTDTIRYVGQTHNIKYRYYRHLYTDNVNKAKVKWIAELSKCEMTPEVIIIEVCDNRAIANVREIYWIRYYNRAGNLLNVREKSQGPVPVVQYDRDGNYVANYSSITEAERITGIDGDNISKVICIRHYDRPTAGGYQWRVMHDDYMDNIGPATKRRKKKTVDNVGSEEYAYRSRYR